ncbi:hypothetical protein Bbelb_035940 [Branchiostoma belcheri]|nr:hypothetical protein Bbelb_035940 [Branchiostoma belcheri]
MRHHLPRRGAATTLQINLSFQMGSRQQHKTQAKHGNNTATQTSWQKRLLHIYGQQLVLLDATYRTCRYSVPLFFLCVRANEESIAAIREALQVFKDFNPNWHPSHFMVDFSTAEIAALEEEFQESKVLLCDFHREKAWVQWCRKRENGVADVQEPLLKLLRSVADSTTQEEYLTQQTTSPERIYNPTLNRKGRLRVELSSTWDPALPQPKGQYVQLNVAFSSCYRKYHSNIPTYLQDRPRGVVNHILPRLTEAQCYEPGNIITVGPGVFKVTNDTFLASEMENATKERSCWRPSSPEGLKHPTRSLAIAKDIADLPQKPLEDVIVDDAHPELAQMWEEAQDSFYRELLDKRLNQLPEDTQLQSNKTPAEQKAWLSTETLGPLVAVPEDARSSASPPPGKLPHGINPATKVPGLANQPGRENALQDPDFVNNLRSLVIDVVPSLSARNKPHSVVGYDSSDGSGKGQTGRLPAYINFSMTSIERLLQNDVTPLVVFDGPRTLPAKAEVAADRGRSWPNYRLEQGSSTIQAAFQRQGATAQSQVEAELVKGHLGDRCHVEKAVGNDHDNERYCSKDGNVVVRMGHPIRQGQRNDLTDATNFLQENDGDLSALAQEMPETFVCHHRGLEAYVSYARLQPTRDFLTRCFVFVGPPGCGKSRLVREYLPDDTTTYYKPEGGWFDGCMGQSVVLNDFHGDIPRPTFLNMVDRYPLRVPIKGGFVNFAARRVWITTNIFPNHWYTNDHDPAAIFRRITLFQLWDDAAQCFNELEYSNLAPGHPGPQPSPQPSQPGSAAQPARLSSPANSLASPACSLASPAQQPSPQPSQPGSAAQPARPAARCMDKGSTPSSLDTPPDRGASVSAAARIGVSTRDIMKAANW